MLPAQRALVSVYDKRGLEEFARGLSEMGIEIVGDALFTTNIERLKQGVAIGAASSMVLKITQVGTVSEALDAAKVKLESLDE